MKKHLHTQKLRLIIVLLISSTICIQAYSEQQDTNEPEDLFDMPIEELMNIEVVTASKKLEKISDAPATVLVITKQEIRDRGYSNLKDVLHDLPGMEAIEYYFSEIGTLVPIRGVVGNNKIIILVNGMKVNPPGGEEFPLRGDFSVRYAERIEVIYGPGSTLYGQDAISAVINVITQQPAEQLSGEVLGALGTEDHSEGFFALSDTIETEIGTLGISYTLEEKLHWDVTERFSALAGIVLAYYDIIPKATIPGGADRDGDIVSQGGAFTYYTVQGDPSSKVDLPQAYVAPSPYFGHNIYDNGTTMNIANPDLEPEKATSHEINLTYTHKNFSCGTSLYLNKQDNLLIIGDFASTIGQVWIDEAGTTSRLLTHSINSGQSEAKGVDSYLRYNWENLSLWGSYSYVDHESKLLGQTTGLSGISTHNTRVGVTYKPQKKLTATLSAAFRSTPENITKKYSLDDELKDPYVLNLHANYNLNERTRA